MLSREIIAYLGGLTITQGRLAGQPFDVLPWQQRFIRGAFAEGVAESGLSVGRGNGKTTLVAGLGAASLDGPLALPRGETVVVASSFDQGKIAFNHVLAFLREKHDLEDRTAWRVWDSANKAEIMNRSNGAVLKCIGSDPRRAHGLASGLVLADEGAQWEESKNEAMVAALRTGRGKLEHGRLIGLGTQPADSSHWFSKMLHGGADYSQLHAARENDPPFQRRTWKKSNPSLDQMPDLERAIRRDAAMAKLDESQLASFQALRLNQGTSDVVRSVLLSADVWRAAEGDAEPKGKCYWGADLGTSAAQSAISAFWPQSGRLEVLAAFPSEPSLEARGLRDGVGRLYAQCASRGELILAGDAAVDVVQLVTEAKRRFGVPTVVSADRWREAELRDALKRARLRTRLELRGMGFKDGAEDVRAFQRWMLEGRVTPVVSLLMRSAMAEARVVIDPAGNAKLAKNSQGGRRLRARDDAAAAGIQAVAVASRRERPPRAGGLWVSIAR